MQVERHIKFPVQLLQRAQPAGLEASGTARDDERSAELLVLVPPAYPAQAPAGFDLRGTTSVNGTVPGGAGARDVDGVAHQHYCWNPQTSIDYTSIDGIWRFAQFSERRFAHLA